MQANSISNLLHYLDDYFMAGPVGSGNCHCNINTMVEVCKEMGFAVNPSKVTAPSPVNCFLGIDIDSCKGVACIDPECLEAITHELTGFQQAKLATKWGDTFTYWQVTFCLQGMSPRLSVPVQDD